MPLPTRWGATGTATGRGETALRDSVPKGAAWSAEQRRVFLGLRCSVSFRFSNHCNNLCNNGDRCDDAADCAAMAIEEISRAQGHILSS